MEYLIDFSEELAKEQEENQKQREKILNEIIEDN